MIEAMPKTYALILWILSGTAVAQQQKTPAPLETSDCNAVVQSKELPNTRFARKGGRTTTTQLQFRGGVLSVKNVAEGRDLEAYERLILVNTKPTTVVERKTDPTLPKARTFLWQHWHDHK